MSFRDLLDTEDLHPKPPKRWWYLIGAALVVTVAIGGWVAFRSGGEPVATSVSAAAASPTTAPDGVGTTPTAEPTTTTALPGPPDLTLPLPPSEDVEIVTDDGLALSGRLYPGGQAAILLGHTYDTGQGASFDSEQILPVAGAFSRAGYTVLAFDHRGHGRSPGEASHLALSGDVTAAFRFLRQRGAGDIYVVAWGVSGTATIISGADGDIDPIGVVALFARPQFLGMDAQAVIADTDEPYLFISVDAGRSTNWARILVRAARDGAAYLAELPAPPAGSDPVTAFWPAVVERSLEFFADTTAG